MHARQIDAALREITDQLKSKSAADSDVPSIKDLLLKYADEHNLAPAQLEKLGTTMNVSLAIAHTKQAAPDARGDNFDLIDVPALVERFTDPGRLRSKQAAQAPNVTPEWVAFSVGHNFRGEPTVDWNRIDNVMKDHKGGWHKAASETETLMDAAALHNARVNADQARQLAAEFNKSARMALQPVADIVERSPQAYVVVAQDVEALMESKAAATLEVFDNVLRARRFTPPAVPEDTRDFFTDRHDVLDAFHKAADDMASYHVCCDLAEEYQQLADTPAEKIAAGAGTGTGKKTEKPNALDYPSLREYQPSANAGRDTSEQDKALREDSREAIRSTLGLLPAGAKAVADVTSGVGEAARESVSPDTARFMADNYTTLFGQPREQAAKKLETSMQRWQQAAVLQRLLMSDEVLSKAPPANVIAAFETIRKANPSVARDISVARILLREAVQYQGVPLQSVETLNKLNRPAPAQDDSTRKK